MTEPKEADITISGEELTFAQSMTVRVALQHFASSLRSDGLGDDVHGKLMVERYLARIDELNRLIDRTAR